MLYRQKEVCAVQCQRKITNKEQEKHIIRYLSTSPQNRQLLRHYSDRLTNWSIHFVFCLRQFKHPHSFFYDYIYDFKNGHYSIAFMDHIKLYVSSEAIQVRFFILAIAMLQSNCDLLWLTKRLSHAVVDFDLSCCRSYSLIAAQFWRVAYCPHLLPWMLNYVTWCCYVELTEVITDELSSLIFQEQHSWVCCSVIEWIRLRT